MTPPTPSPESDPPSPAELFDNGLAQLNLAVLIVGSAKVDAAEATMAATMASAYFAAGQLAHTLRGQVAQRPPVIEPSEAAELSEAARKLRETALRNGWTEGWYNTEQMFYVRDGNQLEIMLCDGVPDRAYLNREPIDIESATVPFEDRQNQR